MDCKNCNNQDCEDCINRKVKPLFQPSTMHLHLPMSISVLRNHQRGRGMGFLQPEDGGGDSPVGAIAAVVGAIGAGFSRLFGGAGQRGKDEAKSGEFLQASVDGIYRLKAAVQSGQISKEQATVEFNGMLQTFTNQINTLQTDSVRESRLRNQTRDLKNLFEKEVLALIVAQFLPGPSGGTSPTGPLPGYCPAGTYHPIEDPLACVPFPEDAADLAAQAVSQTQQGVQRLADQLKARQSRQRALQRAQQQAAIPCPTPGQQRNPATGKCVQTSCPPGTYPDPATGQCVVLPQCSDSLVDIETGQCVEPGGGGLGDVPSWLWLLLLALVLGSSGGGGERSYRRGR